MRTFATARVCALFIGALSILSSYTALAQIGDLKSFASYRAATHAFIAAVSANDDAAIAAIIGTKAQDLLSSGDEIQDANARRSFLRRYHEMHAYVRESADRVLLTVGNTQWQLPFPIVRMDGVWHFDADEGAQELVYRRIGQNELDAIKVCRALYAAQKRYATHGHDGNPAGLYAQRFRSDAGTENGLYWNAKDDEAPSPAGELVAQASSEGYEPSTQQGTPTPFHGYFYRILKSQGASAPGGQRDYLKDGKMSAGFAILASPAEYRSSGVMSFMIGARGELFQKDLGRATTTDEQAQTVFDPDRSWKALH